MHFSFFCSFHIAIHTTIIYFLPNTCQSTSLVAVYPELFMITERIIEYSHGNYRNPQKMDVTKVVNLHKGQNDPKHFIIYCQHYRVLQSFIYRVEREDASPSNRLTHSPQEKLYLMTLHFCGNSLHASSDSRCSVLAWTKEKMGHVHFHCLLMSLCVSFTPPCRKFLETQNLTTKWTICCDWVS